MLRRATAVNDPFTTAPLVRNTIDLDSEGIRMPLLGFTSNFSGLVVLT